MTDIAMGVIQDELILPGFAKLLAIRQAEFAPPDFALTEVTDDPRYGGGSLAAAGLPAAAPYPGARPSAA